ncbi:MAG: porin [Planctomycetota bacterium]
MRRPLLALPLLLAAAAGAQDDVEARLRALEAKLAEREAAGDGTELRVRWDDGLVLEGGDVTLELSGRVYWDLFWVGEDDAMKTLAGGPQQDGSEVRALRFGIEGELGEHVEFELAVDFAGAEVDIKDAWIGLRHVPVVQHLRFGYAKEPMGMEELTSSRYITFMERAVTMELVPGRDTGIAARGADDDERVNWALGWFQTVGDEASTQLDGNHAFTGRVSGTPLRRGEADLVHLGASASWRNRGTTSYELRPENHQGAKVFDTGTMAVDDQWILGLEAAWLSGPLARSSRSMCRDLAGGRGVPGHADSARYAQVSLFLTHGDHRAYTASKDARHSPPRLAPVPGGEGIRARRGRGRPALVADRRGRQSTAGVLTDVTVGLDRVLDVQRALDARLRPGRS